jgi:hypothetical protein
MVDLRAPLTERQLTVLKWVESGCPDDVPDLNASKQTARALQNRRLVRVSRKDGLWRAGLTTAGRYYLDHGEHPPTSSRAPRPLPLPPPPSPRKRAAPRAAPSPRREPRPKPLPVTEQLIADLIASGGELRIDRDNDKANYEVRVGAAIRHGKVPEGKLLTIEHSTWKEWIIRLQDPPAWMTAVLNPIPVPSQLRNPHPVVKRLQGEDSLQMTKAVQPRAFRLIQALLAEAERREYRTRFSRPGQQYGQNRGYSADEGHFIVAIHGDEFGVRLSQQVDRTPHAPTPAEERRAARETWFRIPAHDEHPSKRLAIHLTNGRQYRQTTWTDSDKHQLEAWLPQVLQEIELRAGFAEQQRLEQEREAAERERLWKEAMSKAERRYAEDHRAGVLKEQMMRWRLARELDAYLTELRSGASALSEEDGGDAEAWIAWIEQYRIKIDPIGARIVMPETPKPRSDDLAAYLPHGMNPYGPNRW